ncbi:MAG TPA: hypothetical protein VFN25_11175 [Dokdonella sp.]|uniref:hypothetical protein n=1 Tax=Dokdonella sp. TaxID=2291710 RepID=UPI002D808A60|nr:hypothetical protein [Dokdonella sp.]HET9033454.1 hypothetical protein [Dokdonella sp.]
MNTKMKTLSLAVLGLVGFGAAGAAMAQTCPSNLSPPWSLVSTLQGTATSQSGGYDGTQCRLRVALNQNSSPAAKAFVLDQTPASEQRYRVQFIVDTSGLGLTQANRNAAAFQILGASAPAGASGRLVSVLITGNGSSAILRIFAGDTNTGGFYQAADVVLPNQAGANRVEFDLTIGAAATMKYWVNDVATATTEGSTTGTFTNLANSGWGGVDQATLGLSTANTFYRQNFTNTSYVYFDQFDSRRQSFIGN